MMTLLQRLYVVAQILLFRQLLLIVVNIIYST